MKRFVYLTASLTLLFSSFAHGFVDNNLIIQGHPVVAEYSVGSGINTSYLVVDFANTGGAGHPDASYLFEYKWTAAGTTSNDMLNAISNAVVSNKLTVDSTDYGAFGIFIDNYSYLNETGAGDPFTYTWRFESGTLGPDGSNPSLTNVSWADENGGITLRLLSDMSIDGWIYSQYQFDDTFTFISYTSPITDPRMPLSLPEPTTLLTLVGIPLCLIQRKKVR